VSNGRNQDHHLPGGDGGTVTFNVKDALVSFATMSADSKAALDLQITVTSVTVPPAASPWLPSGSPTAAAMR